MNWIWLMNTGPYPEENLWGSMKIILVLVIAIVGLIKVILGPKPKSIAEKASVAERAGLVKPPKRYVKLNGAMYRILDEGEYERFWWGRHRSSRVLFEDWLKVPTASMRDVSMRHGKRSTAAILRLVKMLKVRGILRREGLR